METNSITIIAGNLGNERNEVTAHTRIKSSELGVIVQEYLSYFWKIIELYSRICEFTVYSDSEYVNL